MPPQLPHDTQLTLGQNLKNCYSRSLWQDRMADPSARDNGNFTPRKDWFIQFIKKEPEHQGIRSWAQFLKLGTGQESGVLYAQLQSRMMVNMAGGVMENAGLCLDRFGMPFIPGSAVKGCARRAALAALREWTEEGQKPTGDDRPLAAATEGFSNPAQMLAAIALVFGWCEQDWGDKSDFVWASGTQTMATLSEAAKDLAKILRLKIPAHQMDAPWRVLPNLAGLVAFLAGKPLELGDTSSMAGLQHGLQPAGTLELDILTCHHPVYYQNESQNEARDVEEPVPVVFPAVEAGQIFVFVVRPITSCLELECIGIKPEDLASRWLALSLRYFGIGAKTMSGHGWFEVKGCQQAVTHHFQSRRDANAILKERESLRPDPAWQQMFKALPDSGRRGIINIFAVEPKFWPKPNEGPLGNEGIQLSLLHYLTHIEPEYLAQDRQKASSKISKALVGLKSKYGEMTA